MAVKSAFTQTPAALDPSANLWTTGSVSNAFTCGLFTTPNPPQPIPCNDATVTKFDPTGTQVLFTTTLGGHGNSGGVAIASDPGGNIYIAGYTTAPDFPVTAGALQTTNAGPFSTLSPPYPGSVSAGGDAFIVELNSSGSIVYSTFLGGSGNDIPTAIAVDRLPAFTVYVAP